MSEEANPPVEQNSQSPEPSSTESKKQKPSVNSNDPKQQKLEFLQDSTDPADPPSDEKPVIQVGHEQFSQTPQPNDAAQSEEKDEPVSEANMESGPRKILQELEKDLSQSENPPPLSLNEEIPPELAVIDPAASVKESFSSTDLSSTIPPSAEELISDAIRRLDEILRKIKATH